MLWLGVGRGKKSQHTIIRNHRLSGQEGLQSLPIHFEFRVVLRIYNNHNTVWKNGAHDERSRPTSLQLPRKNMKPRVIQQNLVSRGKVFLGYELVMKKFSPAFGDPSILIGFIPYLL